MPQGTFRSPLADNPSAPVVIEELRGNPWHGSEHHKALSGSAEASERAPYKGIIGVT